MQATACPQLHPGIQEGPEPVDWLPCLQPKLQLDEEPKWESKGSSEARCPQATRGKIKVYCCWHSDQEASKRQCTRLLLHSIVPGASVQQFCGLDSQGFLNRAGWTWRTLGHFPSSGPRGHTVAWGGGCARGNGACPQQKAGSRPATRVVRGGGVLSHTPHRWSSASSASAGSPGG